MIADETGDKGWRGILSKSARRRGTVPLWLAGCLAVLLLVAAGIVYRVEASRLADLPPVSLDVPLSNIPLEINGWTGQDVPLEASIREYMESNFADDYINRQYTSRAEGMHAGLYVVYCSSRLAGMTGHNPDRCYFGGGWIRDEKLPTEFISTSGRRVPCWIYRFHKAPPQYQRVAVLSFYVLNGVIKLDEREFSDLWGRSLNRSGDSAHYVAQVQVSAPLEQSARAALGALADTIFDFLPDQNGHVQAAYWVGEGPADSN
ncbi:MAG: EpsI family protein [Sedimentisphaerales bacterium]|nr:EpsI family protein [Sedimentisphaerales bacterium]